MILLTKNSLARMFGAIEPDTELIENGDTSESDSDDEGSKSDDGWQWDYISTDDEDEDEVEERRNTTASTSTNRSDNRNRPIRNATNLRAVVNEETVEQSNARPKKTASIVPIPITPILDDSDSALHAAEQEIMLPPHHPCTVHKINSVATTDVKEAAKNSARFKLLRDATFQRCKKFWNRQERSSQAAEKICDMFGRHFPTPNDTRWNSEQDAMAYMDKILSTRRTDVNDLCTQFELDTFRQCDADFIKEYLKVTNSH